MVNEVVGLAIDHNTQTVSAYNFERMKAKVFKELKALLEPIGITIFYSDDWSSYERKREIEQYK